MQEIMRTIAALMFAFLSSSQACKAAEVAVSIDAADVLAKNFGIATGKTGRKEECLPLEEHTGFAAKKVPCEYFTVINNIKIEKILKIVKDNPRIDDIDTSKDESKYTLNNCLSTNDVFDRTVKHHT